MVFDVHVHSWRYPDHFKRQVIVDESPPHRRSWDDERFKRIYDQPIENYLEASDGVVGRGLLLGIKAADTMGFELPNDYLADLARAHSDRLSWACCVVPTDRGAAAEVERCIVELGATGVGELGPGYANYRADDSRCLTTYEVARDHGVPIIIHAGPTQTRTARLEYADLSAVDNIAIQFPDLKIVLCHLGYYRYEEACYIVAKHPNVYADISWNCGLAGLDRSVVRRVNPVVEDPYYHLLYPLLYYYAQTFGEPHKLIFGSDYPATHPQKAVDIVRNLNRLLDEKHLPRIPQEALDRILDENWKEVFPKLAAS